MLAHGRIPLEEAEYQAISELLRGHEGESASFSRRDPGETGPLIAQIGASTWEIAADGRSRKLKEV